MKLKLNPLAQRILDHGESPNDIEEPELVEYMNSISKSDGFWYALNNGYIDLNKIIIDKDQVNVLEEARELLTGLESIWEKISYEF